MDFDALYRGESPAPGIPPITTPPWDTKAPKENVIAWQEAGLIHGDVLDIGCGLGDNAIYLAEHGHTVTGLDISPTALITAERRSVDAKVHVRFATTDATRLDGYTDAFDTVVDSGCYHCLDDAGRTALRRGGAPRHPPGRHPAAQRVLRRQRRGRGLAPADGVRGDVRRTLGDAGWTITSLESLTVPLDAEGVDAVMWMLRAQR